jgi:hypothetical protein
MIAGWWTLFPLDFGNLRMTAMTVIWHRRDRHSGRFLIFPLHLV